MAAIPRKEPNPDNRPEDAAFTVKDLLRLPLFSQARLMAGEKGIHAAITRVNVMEVPDTESRVRAGELLVTAGYPFREEPEKLRQLIPELAKRGVAALGIRSKRFVDDVPKEVMEEADRQRVPLIELPPETSFSDVVRTVMESVLAQETALLADLQNRIQSMTRLLLDGSGLYAFLDAMESMLGNPVAVVREQEKPWLSEGLRNADPVEAWPLVQSLTYRHVGRGVSNGFVQLQNACRAYVHPIPARRTKQACLVLLERNRDILPLDALSVERLSSLAGLELANVEAVREVEGKYLDQFLQDWLQGKIVSESDWKLRAEVCGCAIPEQTPLCAVIVGLTEQQPSADRLRELARRLRSERLRVVDAILAAPIGGELALILPVPEPMRLDPQAEASPSGMLQRLLAELRPLLGDPDLKLYSGRVSDRTEQLPASLSQAKRARQVAEVCGLQGEVVTYDRLGVYSLLYLIPNSEEREQFLGRFSVPLQQADRKGGGRLVETLEMFFRCNGNIKLTSEKLFAHYNTVVYRLDKIQSILGVSLDDPEDRLQLQLSLKLGQITPGPSGSA
ncbi:PucR family transcriptional regulator [Cohnella thailandensis]|uniref:PucR family transcriptional regulator ligand-binding domain-containing protein n=1 Tax=Cohnella thailandensis TaxID=557557 RepID=A0A841SXC6_9BACL|nr:PucR family transcriptional regulator [Cohnella thailandensis]MBB6635569.1 PucR family transcriptional regulator ligand-binding domain-containing protein [Cohnella thailandensis]MBP1974949.1 purine catabolism regulator [Cohnella thailandensis]